MEAHKENPKSSELVNGSILKLNHVAPLMLLSDKATFSPDPAVLVRMAHNYQKNRINPYVTSVAALAAAYRNPQGTPLTAGDVEYISTWSMSGKDAGEKVPQAMKDALDKMRLRNSAPDKKSAGLTRGDYWMILNSKFPSVNLFFSRVLREELSRLRAELDGRSAEYQKIAGAQGGATSELREIKEERENAPKDDVEGEMRRRASEEEIFEGAKKLGDNPRIVEGFLRIQQEWIRQLASFMLCAVETGLVDVSKIKPGNLEPGDVCIINGELHIYDNRLVKESMPDQEPSCFYIFGTPCNDVKTGKTEKALTNHNAYLIHSRQVPNEDIVEYKK